MSVNIDTDGMIAFIRRLNKKQGGNYKRKKIYLYSLDGRMIKVFETTEECADYFNYPREYIYHNLKYCDKIRHKQKEKWYRISREETNGNNDDDGNTNNNWNTIANNVR